MDGRVWNGGGVSSGAAMAKAAQQHLATRTAKRKKMALSMAADVWRNK